jgi:ligand-binding sensor domain-containing protein
MIGRSLVLFVAVACLTLGACSESPAPAVNMPEVVDRFDVGNAVYVRSLAVDKTTNSLWVGSSVGVMQIDLTSHAMLNNFTRQDPLANEYVFAIGIDSRGYKWFGTNAGGTSRYRDGEWKVYFPMHGLADYWIYAFAEQSEDRFWIGTWAGANLVDLKTMQFRTIKDELVNEWVYGIAVDSRDRVWFGTEGGVSMLDGDSWRHWTHSDGVGAANEDGLPISQNTGLGTRTRHDLSIIVGGQESYNPGYIFAVLADTNDSIWVGTWGGGVSRYDGGAWKNFTMADGLAGNIVYSIAQADDGTYWFGTNRGLSRYDGKTWKNYGLDEGLLGEHVYAIATTENNHIWVGTLNGVVRLAVSPH